MTKNKKAEEAKSSAAPEYDAALADRLDAEFSAKVAKAGGFISYGEVMAAGIPVSAMIERGWENVPDQAGIRKVKHAATAISSSDE